MTNHAKKHKVIQISMRKAGCGLDRLEWHQVERLIKAICAHSNLIITVYDFDKNEHTKTQDDHSKKLDERPKNAASGKA